MAVVTMQKVAIIAEKSLKEDLLETMHREGVLEISESNHVGEVDHTEVKFRAADLQFAVQTLKNVASKNTLAAADKMVTESSILEASLHTDIRGIVDELHKLETSDTEAEKKLQELTQTHEILLPWSKYPYLLSQKKETTTTIVETGILPTANLEECNEELKKELPRIELLIVNNNERETSITFHVWKKDFSRFSEIVAKFGWTVQTLPEAKGTAQETLEELTVEIKKLKHLKEKNNKERVRLSVELPNLRKAQKFLGWLDEKQAARESLAETHGTVTLLGWMPKKQIVLLESRLQKLSPAIMILKVKPDEGEGAPVLLKNSKLITPFQSVTNLYGMPMYNEMDPTRALSPFFILYFALCLTDSGYGAVIALLTGLLLLKTKQSVEEATLVWLLFMSGIVTFFVSIPFGGWFGLMPSQVPLFLTKETVDGALLFRGQVWDLTVESGITFLQNLSIVLGLTHLFFGMFLAGMHKWIHGQKAAAFWMDFTNHIMLGAVIFALLAPESIQSIKMYPLYIALALMIWGKGYGTKWFLRPIVGLLGVVNFSIGMLSNTLSYLRILALGLVTGALAMAVNQVAVELGNLFPIFIAIPLIVTIFVVGHLVSIALNALGSFIHSGRLQFIEFFGQFFEGGGRQYSPFSRRT